MSTDDDRVPRKHEQPVTAKTVFLGILATIALHAAAFAVLGVVALVLGMVAGGDAELVLFFPLIFIGVAQIPYVVPAWFLMRRRGWHGAATGLIIGASLTFLGNSACFGLLLGNGIY